MCEFTNDENHLFELDIFNSQTDNSHYIYEARFIIKFQVENAIWSSFYPLFTTGKVDDLCENELEELIGIFSDGKYSQVEIPQTIRLYCHEEVDAECLSEHFKRIFPCE